MPDIDITDRTFSFACRVVKLCKLLEKDSRVSGTLANQLLRSATSIGANIEEAQAGQSKADFIAKIYISCKEARETLYWIRILIKTEIVSQDKLADLADEAKQLVAILTTITKSAQANK